MKMSHEKIIYDFHFLPTGNWEGKTKDFGHAQVMKELTKIILVKCNDKKITANHLIKFWHSFIAFIALLKNKSKLFLI